MVSFNAEPNLKPKNTALPLAFEPSQVRSGAVSDLTKSVSKDGRPNANRLQDADHPAGAVAIRRNDRGDPEGDTNSRMGPDAQTHMPDETHNVTNESESVDGKLPGIDSDKKTSRSPTKSDREEEKRVLPRQEGIRRATRVAIVDIREIIS